MPGITVTLIFGGENGWHYALLCTAAMAFVYGLFFFKVARNTPQGSTYFKPKKSSALSDIQKRSVLLSRDEHSNAHCFSRANVEAVTY